MYTALALPNPFGKYHILRELGRGGMGMVYLAQDSRLDRTVALKLPNLAAAPEPEIALERFRREARAIARLHHPNICPIFEVDEIDGIHYLAMAYVDGQTLGALIDREKPFPISTAVALVHRLALALEEAHHQGILHRDLKPGNILIDRRGEPILIDFGLARRLDETSNALSRPGDMIGTPKYMPPEQINGQNNLIGPTCDVYSLGIILYELLTGTTPFQGPNLAVLVKSLQETPPNPVELRPDLDPRLAAVCLQAIQREARDRYPNMTAFAAALTPWLPGLAGNPTLPVPPPTVWPPPKEADRDTPAPGQRDGPTPADTPDPVEQSFIDLPHPVVPGGPVEVLPSPALPPGALPAGPAPANPLSPDRLGRVHCLHCGARLRVLARAIGRAIRCQRCQMRFILSTEAFVELEPPTEVQPLPIIPVPGSHSWFRILGVIGIVAAILGAQLGVLYWFLNQPSTTRPTVATLPATAERDFENSLGMRLFRIEPGTFFMGSPLGEIGRRGGEEEQLHEVELTQPFYLGMREVTCRDCRLLREKWPEMKGLPIPGKGMEGGDDYPVHSISWTEAKLFCQLLSELEVEKKRGRRYRLPTEAEWEYACRAGTRTPYSCGQELSRSFALFESKGLPRRVGLGRANAWQLEDMHGNVGEWCEDSYAPYPVSKQRNPRESSLNSLKIWRGGHCQSAAEDCRSARRHLADANQWTPLVGFRIVCEIQK